MKRTESPQRFLTSLMRWIYVYLAVFSVICLVLWIILRDEPTALIAGVFGATGIESIAGAYIRSVESRNEKKYTDCGGDHSGAGGNYEDRSDSDH